MNYQETIDFLFGQMPVFQKDGGSAYKPGLERIFEMSDRVGNPHQRLKTVHIAGTNGKGSTSSMTASILQEAGYKVGLFSSPHLVSFRERIKINGAMIPKEFVVEFVAKFKDLVVDVRPSFFEYTTLMAFEYFAHENVDIAIIETGLGGRLDCSNIITPEVSLITNIGLDHVQFLGPDLPSIAKEKAGIIKPNVPVVIGKKQPETWPIFEMFAENQQSALLLADQTPYNGTLDLLGAYQRENAQAVIKVCEVLLYKGWKISANNISQGLANVVKNTGLQGRWQILSQKPLTICDTGHNEDGISVIVDQLAKTPHKILHMVLGMMNDKTVDTILKYLPQNAKYYWCAPNYSRAIPAPALKILGGGEKLKGEAYPSVQAAYNAAKDQAQPDDLIFVGGSSFVVAEVLKR